MVLGYGLHYAVQFHFIYRFPHKAAKSPVWSLLLWIFYAAFAVEWANKQLSSLILLGVESAIDFRFAYDAWLDPMNKYSGVFIIGWMIACCAVAVQNYRRVPEPDVRRRIKWVICGVVVSSLVLIYYFAALLLGWGAVTTWNARANSIFPQFVVSVGLMAMPAMLGYAILKHRVFDINVVVRRSLRYLLAKNGLRFLILLPVAGLVFSIFSDLNRTLSEILFRNSVYFYVLLIATVALGSRFGKRLNGWVDRRFFREAYDSEQILLRLPETIKNLDSINEISRLVSREIERAVHPEKIYLFHRDEPGSEMSLEFSSGAGTKVLRVPANFDLLGRLEHQMTALDFPALKLDLPGREKAWLKKLGANLIVPVSESNGRLSDLLVLGGKKSEEPYTPRDRRLLEALAAQIGVMSENLQLKSRAARESKIKREVLARFERQNINLVKECPKCGSCFDGREQICPTDESALALSLPVERVIDGKYRLERLVGAGGMGAVYAATDLRFERRTAIKIMLGSMFGDSAALRRFEREARAAARLNHPNIVTVHDYGRLEAGAAEGAYLVMEFVRGTSLRDELKRTGKIAPAPAAALLDQIFAAVQAAHNGGVLHRDLKPENILINDELGMMNQIQNIHHS